MQNKILITMTLFSFLSFELFAQNKKAIPAGRYEALSGIKTNRNGKNAPDVKGSDGLGLMRLFWLNVVSYLPEGQTMHPNVFVHGNLEIDTKVVLDSKGVKYIDKEESADIVYSDNITRDISKFLKSKNKNILYVIEDSIDVRDVILLLGDLELVTFSHHSKKNLYLIKLKSI